MKNAAATPRVSVVIPLYNEAKSLPELYERLADVFKRTGWTYELIFVDDGSRDGSDRVLKDLWKRDPNVRFISFRRNFGKSAGLATGFRAVRGEFVITMDADLQDDPAEIPALIAKLEEGYDLVSGWKKKRHDPLSKTLPSKLFNRVTGALSGIRLHDFNCGLKAYRQEVVKELPVYGELHRFLPVLAYKLGYRITELPVLHTARKYGKTKFGASRFVNGFFDLLTVLFISDYNRAPLHLFGSIGLFCALAGFAINLYLTIGWLNGLWIGNRPMLFLGVLLMVVGIQFFSFGLIAEKIVNVSERDRVYSIREDSGESGGDASGSPGNLAG
ncbi:glycosyltransferase family 2 protein [bacterium]|nr:glycosyltransferase family 2 protein [bacterium]MBU1983674.1 glycosyltransferase family 2 protein [bacterium]